MRGSLFPAKNGKLLMLMPDVSNSMGTTFDNIIDI
jgi:hypothetical protein